MPWIRSRSTTSDTEDISAEPVVSADAPAVAWAYWRGWRGPPELVSHIARRCRDAAKVDDRPAPSYTIDVVVGESGRFGADTEPFTDRDDFAPTGDALRRFSVVRVRATGPTREIVVEFVRRPSAVPDRPQRGVWLTVIAVDGEACEARDSVAAAIARNTGRNDVHTGEVDDPARVADAVTQADQPPSRRSDTVKAISGLAAAVPGLINAVSQTSEFSRTDWIVAAIGAAVVAGGTLAVWLLFPRVQIQSASRARRSLQWIGVTIASGLIGALISSGVSAALGV
jgi:hypothetical protein